MLTVFFLLYLLSLRGRTGHKGLQSLRGWRYAHRGLHGQGVPENSMAAFRNAFEKGYGIELDVHLMADGTLAVIHDSSLKRTAGADITIEDLTAADLAQYVLEDTAEQIPTLPEVLALCNGRAPMIIELKTTKDNQEALCDKVLALLAHYKGAFCIESFDPKCVRVLKIKYPQIIRGQLSENFLKSKPGFMPKPLRFVMTFLLTNFLTAPDFVAYRFSDCNHISPWLCRKLWRVQGVAWTIRTPEDMQSAERMGLLPIFEGFLP